MLTYVNIDKNNGLVYDAPEKVYEKKELLEKFEEFIKQEGFSITWESSKRAPYVATIKKDGKEYTLVMYLKNITGAGWADKPHMKRVQVSNVRKDDMDKYIDTTNNQTILILGYYNFDENEEINIEKIAIKRGWILKGQTPDVTRTSQIILSCFTAFLPFLASSRAFLTASLTCCALMKEKLANLH